MASLRGFVSPPGDKSISHRLALIALAAGGGCRLTNLSTCRDVQTSLAAVESLGVKVDRRADEIIISGASGRIVPRAELDCGNSGTTIRLIMGLLAGMEGTYTLDGDESLRRRPMERVARPLRQMGAGVTTTDGSCPLTITGGGLRGIDYDLPVASAQLKSAVMLAGVRARGRTTVHEPVASRDHTERLLSGMGAGVEREGLSWRLEPGPLTLPRAYRVPGDVSSAAFFLCAAAVMPGSRVEARGVLLNPTRTGFLDVLQRMGAEVEVEIQAEEPEPVGRIMVTAGPVLTGCVIPGREIPLLVDEVPILALAASQARGETVFEEVAELRIKESDRLAAVATQLGAMGADIEVTEDRMIVRGPTPLTCPAGLDSFGDHRMAMTLRLAAALAGGETVIRAEDSAAVSYPTFHQDLARLLEGGQ